MTLGFGPEQELSIGRFSKNEVQPKHDQHIDLKLGKFQQRSINTAENKSLVRIVDRKINKTIDKSLFEKLFNDLYKEHKSSQLFKYAERVKNYDFNLAKNSSAKNSLFDITSKRFDIKFLNPYKKIKRFRFY